MGAGITTVLSSQDCGPTFPSSLPVGEGAWWVNPGDTGQLWELLCAVGSGVLTQGQKTACSHLHQPSPEGSSACLSVQISGPGVLPNKLEAAARSPCAARELVSDAHQALLCPDASGPKASTCGHRSVPFSRCFSLTSNGFWFGGDWLMGAPDTPFSTPWVDWASTDQGLSLWVVSCYSLAKYWITRHLRTTTTLEGKSHAENTLFKVVAMSKQLSQEF